MGKPKPSRHQRGYGTAWDNLRAQAKRLYPWVCHLCGQPIARDATGKQGWTLDHLDPIQWNGTDLPRLDRVRPAHLSCNVRRSHETRRWGGPTGTTRRRSRNW